MANVTIPNLTSATTIAPSTDLMVLEQTNGTRKATLSQIFTSSATSGSGLGITSGGVYTIKSGLDSNISDINTLLGNTSIASIGDGTVTGAVSRINTDLSNKQDLLDKGQVSGVNIDNVGGSGGVGIGCYFLYSGSTSGTQPVSGNYILISLKASTTFQIALPYNIAGHTMMVRMYVNNVWTAWKDV